MKVSRVHWIYFQSILKLAQKYKARRKTILLFTNLYKLRQIFFLYTFMIDLLLLAESMVAWK